MNGLKYGISDSKLVAGAVASFIAMHIATITGFWYGIIQLAVRDAVLESVQWFPPELG